MNFLHICNNFISSKVHCNLILALGGDVITQKIYVPIRRRTDRGVNSISGSGVSVVYDYCIFPVLKYFPLMKALWVAVRFISAFSKNKENYVVAHSLWSDGLPAFLYSCIRRRKYCLFVRGTDINFFIPKLPHYRPLMWLMLRYSDLVVFLSPAQEDVFKVKYPCLYRVISRRIILPNGVDRFWLDNIYAGSTPRKGLIFVGRLDRNKNIDVVVDVHERLSHKGVSSNLRIVGGDSEDVERLIGAGGIPPGVDVVGKVADKNLLLDLYRKSSVLIVPSKSETFGLVYIEALTQGCAVVHTKGQGIDGYFDGCDFVRSAHCRDIDQLSICSIELIEKYPEGVMSGELREKLQEFSWDRIAKRFYTSISKEG
ncbi:glycosyltransferase family 4 protein [Metapseudomonas resinovorans]|uniref:Putative glycosyltransferase n=1 Tax=Metapseudomonas resinovorans NBRC 106553 TaxID=1245471 RepID=S6BF81_METRE|nr:glycosyltransferase family 4 protein [Pseudomonas resinovorans]BAN47714.1 putative glycosyltransferase [Pseudomonas resinovorans NBRC 106553]